MEDLQIHRYTHKHYVRLFAAFLMALSSLVIIQFAYLFFKGIIGFPLNVGFILALLHQLGYASIVALLLLPAFKLLGNWYPDLGFKFTIGVLVLLLILESSLVIYYMATFTALGESIKEYSLISIFGIMFDSENVNIYSLLMLAVVMAIFYYGYGLTSKHYHYVSKTYPFTIVLLSLFVISIFFDNKPISSNKTKHLAVRLANHYTGFDENLVDRYVDREYPFLRIEDTPNVLGSQLDSLDRKPNLVFLVVEGLGSEFVGTRAKYPGCMPFLDSISKKSLYWDNFLSAAGRSFGSIPAIMGSLPPGEAGFMAEEPINRNSLFTILKKAGYYTGYYQGTNGSLDNLDNFLSEEEVDFVLDRGGFGTGYMLQPEDERGGSWGYSDKELFRKCARIIKPMDQPTLEVFTTISSHEPFKVPEQELYEQKVDLWLENSPQNPEMEKIIKRSQNIFASLFYTDDALKGFFEHRKRQEQHKKTIYIITGDHRLSGLPLDNELSIFRVPLMIYSPLLKEPKSYKELASHYDIAPTLLAYLRNNHNIKTPEKVAWLGSGLHLKNNIYLEKGLPLMRYKNRLTEYIKGNQLISGDEVFEIQDGLRLIKTEDSNNDFIKTDFERFLAQNHHVFKNDKLIPPQETMIVPQKAEFNEREMVYINSVFPGKDYDRAYEKAKDLAFSQDYEKADLVCRYILSEVPGHIDTKILRGRINAWQGKHETAISILLEGIKKFPSYADGYAALLDVYYWADQNELALDLAKVMKENSIADPAVNQKLKRALDELKKHKPKGHLASL